ncbi:F5/8 type C domain-containing protein [Cohnella sp. OV330]|uniref:glycosyl hydrolase n=1 Tax=Cohnella sp. OV330 TaxID=1855288 RepID=UPI0008E02100|nr:glycosyl hydrolase [Cohnella sp. OV330]SFB06457.1 F5/8 type C domain-containing protein [Cohnella sp. OV330]
MNRRPHLRKRGGAFLSALLALILTLTLALVAPGNQAAAASSALPSGALDPAGWKITTTLDDGAPDLNTISAALFDGDPSTAWTSAKNQSPWGLVLQIDMQRQTAFDSIAIDTGDSPNYGREYTIQSDADWSATLATVPGQSGVTVIKVPRTTARLVNVWQTGSNASPWTVAEARLYDSDKAYPGESGLAVKCTSQSCELNWSEVAGASAYRVYRAGGPTDTFERIGAGDVVGTVYSDTNIQPGHTYFYKISAVVGGAESGLSGAVSGIPGDSPFGPYVHVFDPSMGAAAINAAADAIFAEQERSEFGSGRHAMLFKPGDYEGVNVKVGFYTQVSGLGQDPDDVDIRGAVNANADWNDGNALVNFWRSAENFSVTPPAGSSAQWAVAQAAPMRRVHIKGQLELFDFDPWWNAGLASGGFLADSKIDGTIVPASQQQWFSRNNAYGSWSNGVWNMVFVGDEKPPAGTFPADPYTVVDKTPVMREKPYLYIDEKGAYQVFVPSVSKDSQGVSWQNGSTPGTSVPIGRFYIASPESSDADSVNAALNEGMNVLFTPGIYHLSDTIRVDRPNASVMGLGFATLIPADGKAAMTVADEDGIIVSSLLFDADAAGSPELLQVGPEGASRDHAANPISLHDLFFRVGGAHAGKTDANLVINSDDVIGDHFWIWRADHGASAGGWRTNDSMNGLVVNGEDVTVFGLFNEHHNAYQTLWNGERGRLYFYQSEIPYEVPDQASWMSGGGKVNGYASYKVADGVTDHEAWGLGIYSYFRDAVVKLDSAIEVPDVPGVKIHHATSVLLAGNGEISHVVNQTGTAAKQGGVRQTVAEYAGGDGSVVWTALNRADWIASAYKDAGGDTAAAGAIDGNAGTRWANREAQLPSGDQWFQVDMGTARAFDRVKIESGGDYGRGYRIQVSDNGADWTDMASGTGSETIDVTLGRRTARYLRVVQTGTASSNWWSINEINVYAGGAATAATGVEVAPAALTLMERQSAVLTATVNPEEASVKTVSWQSSDPAVAAVDEAGRVTALKAGSTTITATATDGGYTAQAQVTVIAGDPLPQPIAVKKGVAAIKYLSTDPAKLADVGASWTYNWSIDYTGSLTGMEYVPMLWGPGAVTDDTIAKLKEGKASGRFDSLLGYNEPELAEQSQTRVADAIKLWPRLMETGLRLGSPAVAYTYDDAYAAGKGWLDDFMTRTAAVGYPVDFIALHFYPDFTDPEAVAKLKNTLTAIHGKYGKPIWITEIGAIPFGATYRTPTQALASSFVAQLLPMLDSLPFVERYAWFGDNCAHDQGCAYTSLYDLSDRLTATGAAFKDPASVPPPEPADVRLDRAGWSATASSTAFGAAPEFAFDGDAGRQWSTDAGQVGGEWYSLDMGKTNRTNGLWLDAGANATFDYARGYRVELSVDGERWTTAAAGTGSAQLLRLSWPAQDARYIKVTQTGYDGFWRWTINELNVYGPGSAPTAPLAIGKPVDGASLPAARPDVSYDLTLGLEASGGSAPYSWSVTGLPEGLSFNAATGDITGTVAEGAAAASPYTVTITVKDANDETVSVTNTLAVGQLLGIGQPASGDAIPSAKVGAAYSVQLAAYGGAAPYTWRIEGLPTGLALDANTQAISGKPAEGTDVDSPYEILIRVTDSANVSREMTASLTVAPSDPVDPGMEELAIVAPAPGSAIVSGNEGSAYDQVLTLTATGGTEPYTWSISGLPTGLTFDPATLRISGTPASSGTYSLTITATDAENRTATVATSLTIEPIYVPPYVPPVTTPNTGTETPSADGTLKVTDAMLTMGDAVASVTLLAGTKTAQLPASLLGKAEGKDLELKAGDLSLTLPAAVLKKLTAAIPADLLGDAQVQVSFKPVEAATAAQAVGASTDATAVKLAGDVIEFTLTVVVGDASTAVTTFEAPLTLKLKADGVANPKLGGIFYLAGNGQRQYVDSKYVDGAYVAQIQHFSKYAVLEVNKNFADVPASHWAIDVIKELAAKQIVGGTSETTFEPGRTITRAEFTQLLAGALKLTDEGTQSFADVSAGAWYAKPIALAAEAGILSGRGDGTFDPSGAITRQEMATMIVKAYRYLHGTASAEGAGTTFADADRIAAWAAPYVAEASSLGLLSGRGAGQFSPQGVTTRAEAAQSVYNLLQK